MGRLINAGRTLSQAVANYTLCKVSKMEVFDKMEN